MRTRAIAALAILLAQAARAEVPQTTNYLGTIDHDLPVAMTLSSTHERFDRAARVEGAYLYLAHGGNLLLSGTRTFADGPKIDFSLTELGRNGQSTGALELASGANGTLIGTWKSPDGKRTLPVALTPVARTVTIISAQSDQYEIRTGYLQLLADTRLSAAVNAHLQQAGLERHNQQLQSLAADASQTPADSAGFPWTMEERPALLYASDSLLSIRSLRYQNTGGAHGNFTENAENLAWVDGRLVSLNVAALLPESNWPALRNLCVKELKAQGASDAQDVKFDQETPPVLNFTAQGLLVTFSPYQVGAYAEGEFVVSLPYAAVKSLIPAGSPLAALLPK